MLRIAVPNKGSLADAAGEFLAEAGYRGRRDPKVLHQVDQKGGVELFYLRPKDIATYVASGELDAGITGRDLLLDSGAQCDEIADLGFGASTFRFAGPAGRFSSVADLEGRRIATSYPQLVADHLAAAGVTAAVVRLDGAVENAVRLGVADAVADVVDTGATLREAGLEVFGEPALESSAVLISVPGKQDRVRVLQRRLEGVVVARRYVLMDYDLPEALVAEASLITPGFESPTVSPLRGTGWVAVRVMVPRSDRNDVMDRLYDLGARAILVSSIAAARI